jgi:hypothetical protein
MGKIRVRFIHCGGITSRLIAWGTGSLFSHVEFGTPQGTWIGAHAGSGIQERAANYCTPSREYYYEIPCTAEQEAELLRWARSKIGTKYNMKDILGLALQARSLNNPSRLICSQFVTDGLIHTLGARNVLNVLDNWTYRITPETLHLSPIFVGNLVRKTG